MAVTVLTSPFPFNVNLTTRSNLKKEYTVFYSIDLSICSFHFLV